MSFESFGLSTFRTTFALCPIIFSGGIASSMPGGILPLTAISDALSFVDGLLGAAGLGDFEGAFAHYVPMPGMSIIDNTIGNYPFANQNVAANALIAQPLKVSLAMICPVRLSYSLKLATITSMQSTFKQHNTSEGTYTIATPSFYMENCVMTGMTDISGAQSKQPQTVWKLDFLKPLISLEDAAAAQNQMMSAISGGLPTDGATSGFAPNVNAPGGNMGPATIPAASGVGAAGVGSYTAPPATFDYSGVNTPGIGGFGMNQFK